MDRLELGSVHQRKRPLAPLPRPLMTTNIFPKNPITKAPLIVIISNNEAGLNRDEVIIIMNHRSTVITSGLVDDPQQATAITIAFHDKRH